MVFGKTVTVVSIGISVIINITLILFVINLYNTYNRDSPVIIKEASASAVTYPFLSSRIFTENRNDVLINFNPLRQQLTQYINKQPMKISMYFEYLPSGTSIGINSTDELEMASLVKLPTVMVVYDKISRGELAEETLLRIKEEDIDKGYGDLWKSGSGLTISVKDAVKKSLIESDNTAHQVLYHTLTFQDQISLFENIDIHVVQNGDILVPFISPRSYASILKSLYFSSYLPLSYSNEILDILSQRDAEDGIAAALPDDIIVAQKSGIIRATNVADTNNDCGIVYYPKRPYILCVFVGGEDQAAAMKEITVISQFIYTYLRDINAPSRKN